MLIDTGATVSLISSAKVLQLNLTIEPLQLPVKMVTATQTPLVIDGWVQVEIQIDNNIMQQRLLVGNGLTEDLILGLDFLGNHKCQIDISKNRLIFTTNKANKHTPLIPVLPKEELILKPMEE